MFDVIDLNLIDHFYQFAADECLPRLGAWAARTVEAVDTGPGYRDAAISPAEVVWQYPRSNSAERCTALLWLRDRLGDPRFEVLAKRYADRMMEVSRHGMLDAPGEAVDGGVWYWRDVGLYMTNYTMRVPAAFLQLAAAFGETSYHDAALRAGENLLRMQMPCGVLSAGGYPSFAQPSSEILRHWLPKHRVNSRVGFAVYPLAMLWAATGDSRYSDALDRLADAISHLQHPDGAFGQDWRTDRLSEYEPQVKGHFHAYLLYGLARAAELVPQRPLLARITARLADYVSNCIWRYGAAAYGDALSGSNSEPLRLWRAAVWDAVPGLAVAARVTEQPRHRAAAQLLAVQAMLRAWNCPEDPDRHGAIPVRAEEAGEPWFLGGHFHFWLLLGLMELGAETHAHTQPRLVAPQVTDASDHEL